MGIYNVVYFCYYISLQHTSSQNNLFQLPCFGIYDKATHHDILWYERVTLNSLHRLSNRLWRIFKPL